MAVKICPEHSEERCFAFAGRDLIVRPDGLPLAFSDLKKLKALHEKADFIEEKEFGYCAVGLPEGTLPEGFSAKPVRQVFAEADESLVLTLSRARAILTWLAETKFCLKCGTLMSDHESLTAKVCSGCNKLLFPRIEPCVIVLVNKGDKILLARHVQRNQNVYACIAGFMEAGETAEQAVAREVLEETGIRVKNIRYRGSQSWPFPSQLMLAFTAEYDSGELKLQEDELSDASWFDRDECPATPPPGSVAYKLINGEV